MSSSHEVETNPIQEAHPSNGPPPSNAFDNGDDDDDAPSSPAGGSGEPPKPASTCATIAGVLGNVLEWYDFSLFGFFSAEIAQNFFPPTPDGDNGNLVKSFAIFGAAFCMRPIGGLMIGYVGDKHGRKKALTRALFLMGIPTTVMGMLPTYEKAGGLAIFLLICCRLLQGISVGGQLPASLVWTVERRPREHWGFYGSLPMVAANCGSLLGNLCGALMREIFTEKQLVDYGWRLPFLSGILISLVAVYLRWSEDEHHPNQNVYNNNNNNNNANSSPPAVSNPIVAAMAKDNRMSLVSSSLTPMLWAGGYYLSFVWMAIYMAELLDPAVKNAFWVNAGALLLGMTFMLPIAGRLSDTVGRYRIMATAAASLGLVGPFLVFVIGKSRVPFVAFLAQVAIGIMLAFFGGPLCAWMVESYSPEVRLTSASLGYDIAHATAGGFSPAIATLLYDNVGIYSPGLLYLILALFSLGGLFIMLRQDGATKERDSGHGRGGGGEDGAAANGGETELPGISPII